ncbi:MAG: Z1 domain-containing protein [Mycoplasma sp.]
MNKIRIYLENRYEEPDNSKQVEFNEESAYFHKYLSHLPKYIDSTYINKNINKFIPLFDNFIQNNKNLYAISYGEVQSGKTQCMISCLFKAIDCGIKNFIFFVNSNNELLLQNKERIIDECHKIIDNDLIQFYTTDNLQTASIASNKTFNLFFLLKEKNNIEKFKKFMWKNNDKINNFVIFDDESDVATSDSSENRLETKRSISNFFENQLDKYINKYFFIFFTATPYGLLLIDRSASYAPEYCIVLENDKKKYHGLDFFHNGNYKKIEIIVNENPARQNLEKTINHFLNFYEDHKKSFDNNSPILLINPAIETKIHDEIFKIANDIVDKSGVQVNIKTINRNDTSIPSSKNKPMILIGSSLIGRGITFDYLTHAYMQVDSDTTPIDTILQRARWFGYRNKWNDFQKENIFLFLQEKTINKFENIRKIDNEIRNLFINDPEVNEIKQREICNLSKKYNLKLTGKNYNVD